MRQFFELDRGVAVSRREVGAEIRKLNLIGRKRLTRRAAKRNILAGRELWGFSQSGNAVVRIAYLHGSASSRNLVHRSYRSLSARETLVPWDKVRTGGEI